MRSTKKLACGPSSGSIDVRERGPIRLKCISADLGDDPALAFAGQRVGDRRPCRRSDATTARGWGGYRVLKADGVGGQRELTARGRDHWCLAAKYPAAEQQAIVFQHEPKIVPGVDPRASLKGHDRWQLPEQLHIGVLETLQRQLRRQSRLRPLAGQIERVPDMILGKRNVAPSPHYGRAQAATNSITPNYEPYLVAS
jgi:hypothetical protein